MCTLTAIHPFEKAGFGTAPFHLAGFTESTYQAAHGAPIQPGSTCDYCGTAIRYVCLIQSSDGKKFKVGCDCVRKLDRIDNRLMAEVERQKTAMDRAKSQAKKQATRTRERERFLATFARLSEPSIRETLAAQPNPAIKNDPAHNLLTYVEWLRDNAGHTGCVRAARLIETAIV